MAKMRTGGIRRDRVFKVCMDLPRGTDEDLVMLYLETAITEYRDDQIKKCSDWDKLLALDMDKVVVKRANTKYKDM